VTKVLKNIIISCNEKKNETHIHIWKMGNVFFNVQQMSTQLTTYIECCVYHCTMYLKHLNFINTSP